VALLLIILLILLIGGGGLLIFLVKSVLAFGIVGVLVLAVIIALLLRPRGTA
jgi:hypothetical protein